MTVLKYRDPATGQYFTIPAGAKGERGEAGPPGGVFVGAIIAFGGVSGKIPAGYLPCLGQLVPRASYPELFIAIGTTWGAGDGTNTFGLPEGQGKMLVGAGAGFALGTYGGSANLIIPLHGHGVRNGAGTTDWQSHDHAHGAWSGGASNDHAHYIDVGDMATASGGSIRQGYVPGGRATSGHTADHSHGIGIGGADTNHFHGMSIDGAGSDPANANLPPWAAVTYVIKF